MRENFFKVRVIYADTDKMGVAYYGNYLKWFEIGRTELLRNFGFSYKEAEDLGIRLPVSKASVTYHKPLLYDDVFEIETLFSRNSGVRLRFEYTIWKENEKVASGFTEHVITDENLKPSKPPKVFKDILDKTWNKFGIKESQEI